MKKILSILILVLTLGITSTLMANELTSEQRKEINNITALSKELNIAIPKDKIITKRDIKPIVDLIELKIQKLGYSEKEYVIIGWVCKQNHFHINIKILLKTMEVTWKATGKYRFISIKDAI